MKHIDQMIHAQWLLPMDVHPGLADKPAETLFYKDHSIAVDQGVIVDILPTLEASKRYIAKFECAKSNHLLMPGLINAHTHAAMTLLRGYADDLPLMTWLQDHIWPAEAKWVSGEFVGVGTELAFVEALLGGTTCFNDMYFFPEVAIEKAQNMGFRLNVSAPILDFPSPWAASAQEYLEKTLGLLTDHDGEPLISIGFGPHAPYTVSDSVLETVADQASQKNTWIHMHVHETESEVSESIKQYGVSPLQRLKKLGLLSERFQAVHMTQLSDEDLALVKDTGLHLVHCPESNMKLASGFCPIAKLLKQGTNICIGTDGAASNNDLDMFSEIRTAALLAKVASGDASAYNAYQALYSATMGAAQCFNMQDKVGSLTVGKEADVIAIDFSDWSCRPLFSPISHLVYAINSRQVSDVWVRGRHLVRDRSLVGHDMTGLNRSVTEFQSKMTG